MIKYKTTYSKPYIEKVTVLRESECFVEVEYIDFRGKKNTQRYRKVTDNYQFFDTWQEAKDHLVGVAKKEILVKRHELDKANHKLALMKDLREV